MLNASATSPARLTSSFLERLLDLFCRRSWQTPKTADKDVVVALTPPEIHQRVKRLTEPYNTAKDFDVGQYEAAFAESGKEKGDYISSQLIELADEKGLDLSKFAYFSIGGCEGSEVDTVLSKTSIPKAVLLEFNSSFCESARKRAEKLPAGKEWTIIGGDATGHLEQAVGKLARWKTEEGLQGVVLSVQAVLHELPSRSPNFNLPYLLSQVFRGWEHRIFTSREPCAPTLWPSSVALMIPMLPAEDICTLARIIQKHLNIEGEILEQGEHEALMPSVLAIEVLTKLFYIDSFAHEIQERVTHFTPLDLIRHIEKHLGTNTVTSELICSKGFARNYRALDVQAHVPLGPKNEDFPIGPLPLPACFVRMFGYGRRSVPKPVSVNTLQDFSDGAYPISDLLERGIALSWLTKALYALDLKVFPGISSEHAGKEDEWLKILEHHPEDYSVYFYRGEPVGYWHAMPLQDTAFDRMVDGKMRDGEIRLADLAEYSIGGDYSLYFLCVAMDRRFRLEGFKHLYTSFIQHLSRLAGNGFFIRRMCANAFTEAGESICKTAGMKLVRPHSDLGKVYLLETDELVAWLRRHQPSLGHQYANYFRSQSRC